MLVVYDSEFIGNVLVKCYRVKCYYTVNYLLSYNFVVSYTGRCIRFLSSVLSVDNNGAVRIWYYVCVCVRERVNVHRRVCVCVGAVVFFFLIPFYSSRGSIALRFSNVHTGTHIAAAAASLSTPLPYCCTRGVGTTYMHSAPRYVTTFVPCGKNSRN